MQEKNTQKPIFLQIMGDYPINRVLDFLITFKDYDYSMTDIAENSKVGWTTLNLFWKDLEKHELIKFTRLVGRAKMYRINEENIVVKQLVKMHWTVVKEYTNEILKEKVFVKT